MAYIKTEEVSAIRNELKKRFGHTGLKFGVRKMHHSSVHVTIKSGTIDFSDHFSHGEGYAQINHYHLDMYGEHEKLFEDILNVIKVAPADADGGREWFDKSDIMTDYFHTAFYISMNIGSWDKPYVCSNPVKIAAQMVDVIEDIEILEAALGLPDFDRQMVIWDLLQRKKKELADFEAEMVPADDEPDNKGV